MWHPYVHILCSLTVDSFTQTTVRHTAQTWMGRVFLMHESSRCQSLPQSPPPTTNSMEEATIQTSVSSQLEEARDSNLISIILHVSSSDFFLCINSFFLEMLSHGLLLWSHSLRNQPYPSSVAPFCLGVQRPCSAMILQLLIFDPKQCLAPPCSLSYRVPD